ncbi:MAG: hypothetical protein HC923_10665 [Myxococcales bacterium]|nr:hypothetical protein [Myxococcales bacterium]
MERAIGEVETARDRTSEARNLLGSEAVRSLDARLGEGGQRGIQFANPNAAEDTARLVRDRLVQDPERAIEAMGELDSEAVLSLIA